MASHAYADAQVMAVNGPANWSAIDFSLDTWFQLDLTAKLSSMSPPLRHGIQSMYVDASNMKWGPCFISIQGASTIQNIIIQPNTQGYFPIVCPTGAPLLLHFTN